MLFRKLQVDEKPVNEYLSRKISVISFLSVCAVILIHCCNPTLEPGSPAWLTENFFSQAFCRSAVPFFFFCSGFLFCTALPDQRPGTYLAKWKKRLRTICLPWFLWICIYLVFFWGVYRFLSVWNGVNYFCDWQKSPEPFLFLLKEYFWGDGILHFWFLKRLMLFLICSPVLIVLLRRWNLMVLFLLTILVFTIDNTALSPQTSYFNDDFLSFVLGVSCSVLNLDLRKIFPWYAGVTVMLIWLVLCAIPMSVFQFVYLRNLTGLAALWTFYDAVSPYLKRFERPLLFCSEYTFFIYCFHMIPLSLFPILLNPLIPQDLLRYFGIWVISAASSIVSGWMMKKFIRPAYNVLSGFR